VPILSRMSDGPTSYSPPHRGEDFPAQSIPTLPPIGFEPVGEIDGAARALRAIFRPECLFQHGAQATSDST